MKILAIDPGTDKSAVVMLEASDLVVSWYQNDVLLAHLNKGNRHQEQPRPTTWLRERMDGFGICHVL